MALVDTWERHGNFLFKYRGQFPVLLFLIAIPFLYNTPIIDSSSQFTWNVFAVLVSILGFIIRFYTIGTTPKGTSGRNTKKQIADFLNSTGIYSLVRHPLYLGNYLIWIGIAIFTYNIYFIIIVSLLFWIYYERIMFAEEKFLERKFGEKYLKWTNDTPVFIPSLKNFKKSSVSFSVKSILRREYAGILATVIGFTFIDIVRLFFINNNISISPFILQILIVISIIVFSLRSLKHYTNILEEKDRS